MLALFERNVPNARDKAKKWGGFKKQLDLVVARVGGKITLKMCGFEDPGSVHQGCEGEQKE
ncbi:hypothetical protein PoMZ_10744 [Pyricularia oryzae]|uniref:Uncharacterized protein n=1 Tax=Pyricularia oryzae TaxID=318829 RepID=A0A4P7MYA6_PYROR|nr:hypothetical protein PoMZ_10744 [Pyricularia oryzae]